MSSRPKPDELPVMNQVVGMMLLSSVSAPTLEFESTRSQIRRLVRMTATEEPTLSIGEVSAFTGLTTYTLRFYEQEGLFFAPVRRNAAGRRVFIADEVQWLKVCMKLRSSGMPLPEIRRYAQLVMDGHGNEAERLEILRQHEAKVQQQGH